MDEVILPERFCYQDILPLCESRFIEFKENFNSEKMFRKYYETVCAFLNAKGGHLIFGIRDRDRLIQGIKMNQQQIDDFLLFVDRLTMVVTYQPESREQSVLDGEKVIYVPPTVFRTRVEQITKNQYICIISCYPENGRKYCLTDKSVFVRNHAGNFRVKPSHVVYTQEEVDRMINTSIAKLEKEHNKRHHELAITISDSIYDYYHHSSSETLYTDKCVDHRFPLMLMFMVVFSLIYLSNV